ncbi:MAG: tetratricopeptide repeat protein [Planctomycetes bacterium]|nr:tetratricopeptide repeat protein [Planctomycetota bacterium]
MKTTVKGSILRLALLACLIATANTECLWAARQSRAESGEASEDSKLEYKAHDQLTRGVDLIRQKQEERGLKLISSIADMYPTSKVRFRAALALGDYYREKRNYDLAVKNYGMATKSEEGDEKAEALYHMGICYYFLNDYDKAFVTLRKVTNDYPWSVYANESYYYIGQCHYQLKRWARAVEALEMVGTSVPGGTGEVVLAEAGQRLFTKISDKDLVVLLDKEEKFSVTVSAKSGDVETMPMEQLGKSGADFIGSIPTASCAPVAGILQISGGEIVTISYNDQNTESGTRDQTIAHTVQMVSSASIGFTDGAFREYTKGVFANAQDGQDCFMRVKDLDGNISPGKDKVRVKVFSRYKIEKEVDIDKKGIDLDEEKEEVKIRDSAEINLTENDDRSGIFVGSILLKEALDANQVQPREGMLWVMQGDEVIMEYVDEVHIGGSDPRTLSYEAKALVGAIKDVKIEYREVEAIDLKAKKNLIEGEIFLKLGQIFKDVGLIKQAQQKADEGLERVENVIRTSMSASLERDTVEKAFNIKWDLLMVQDKLQDAIKVCNTLITLFPDSTLVDNALMKIGLAKMESKDPKEVMDATQIFSGILRLAKSDMKAEALYRIAEVEEKTAIQNAELANERPKGKKVDPNLAPAMMTYKKCADSYPESPFAGDSMSKIANYYIYVAKDYPRAIELMEQVFQDYPDASFLDEMLLKWVIAAFRMNRFQEAQDKLTQLLNEYPSSPSAEKGKAFQKVIAKKLGQ